MPPPEKWGIIAGMARHVSARGGTAEPLRLARAAFSDTGVGMALVTFRTADAKRVGGATQLFNTPNQGSKTLPRSPA